MTNFFDIFPVVFYWNTYLAYPNIFLESENLQPFKLCISFLFFD